MKPAQRDAPSPIGQLTIALDDMKLRGMTPAERDVAVASLANLLLEAIGLPARESGNDGRG